VTVPDVSLLLLSPELPECFLRHKPMLADLVVCCLMDNYLVENAPF
jgi:hypothetical protein